MFYDDKANYMLHLPPELRDKVEIKALNASVNTQLDKLSAELKGRSNDKFIAHASEKGIERWEKILGVATPLNSTLQARREALKAKLMTKPPINMRTLKSIIEAYMGVPVDVERLEEFVLKVWYRGTIRIEDLAPLYSTIYDTIPANLIIDISYRFLIWNELDRQQLDFNALDDKKLVWDKLERGEWIG